MPNCNPLKNDNTSDFYIEVKQLFTFENNVGIKYVYTYIVFLNKDVLVTK